jgi:hypothetical protein
MKRLATIIAAAGLALFAVPAQAAEGDFCTAAANDMLSSLDGTWSLKQGPGFALSGAGAIPLPAHPAQSMKLEYHPEAGFSVLSAQGQSMAMAPMIDPGELPEVTNFLTEQENEGILQVGPGCDWDELPTMIGGKNYALEADIAADPGFMVTYVPIPVVGDLIVCRRQSGAWAGYLPVGPGAIGAPCSAPAEHLDGNGQMRMTLIVKVQSADSGSGMLLFKGRSGQHSFLAKAPVTLSR